MNPRTRFDPDLLRDVIASGDGGPGDAAKLEILRELRGSSNDDGEQLDLFLLHETAALHRALAQARRTEVEVRQLLARLTQPPLHPAVFLGQAATDGTPSVLVHHSSTRRVVAAADDVDLDALRIGDEVLLGPELNLVVRRSPYPPTRTGETAVFDRYAPDGRLVLRFRDEETVVDVSGPLRDVPLDHGDLVLWDRNLRMALEKLDRSTGDHLFCESTPAERFEDIGGLEPQIEQIRHAVRLHLDHANLVALYRLRRRLSALLVGPPGVGKTMLAKALANLIARHAGGGRSRFIHVKPAGLHSPWYGQTEANYREVFRAARQVAASERDLPVVIFFDEIDSMGAARGDALSRVGDRVLTSFMAELDGLESRGNIFVVGATNRADALDPALLRPGRLGDLVLDLPRPDRRAARSIFDKHLHPAVPFADASGGAGAAAAREEALDAAVSRIFSPGRDRELATVTFRDGRQRPVAPADLISGAVIAKIVLDATERACRREIATGERGLQVADVLAATDDELARIAGVLTPFNCRKHLCGLPQDVDVVRIDRRERRAERAVRYLRIA